MMRAKGENIYKRKDKRWEGRYHRGRTAEGRLIYGYVYGKDYAEVKAKLDPIKKQAEALRQLYGKGIITYQEWVTDWLKGAGKELKPATVASYYSKIRKYFLPYVGQISLYKLEEETVADLQEQWKVLGLAESSQKVLFRLLSKTLKDAYKKGIVNENPCDNVPAIKIVKNKVRALSRSEQEKLEQAVHSDRSEKSTSAIIALDTGLRIGEIAALRWEDVDFEKQLIYVSHTYQRLSDPSTGKTFLHRGTAKSAASQRVVPMSNKVIRILEGLKKKSKTAYVFSVNGKPCEPRLLTYHFHRVRKRAELETIHFHQLRHTFATRCVENRGDISSISQLMGHSSTQMTLDIYSDSMLEQRIAVINSLNRIAS